MGAKRYHAKSKGTISDRSWHPTMNAPSKETDFSYFSGKRAWWVCGAGHVTFVKIQDVHRGHGCGYCKNKRVCEDNSLLSVYPVVAAEWDFQKNPKRSPAGTVAESARLVAWRCRAGHRWQAKVVDRTRGKKHCPVCTRRKPHLFNSLARLRPDLARQWHPTKNGSKRAIDVTPGSGFRAWWRCRHGAEWSASVCNRTHGMGFCPHHRYSRRANSTSTKLKNFGKQLKSSKLNSA